MRDLTIVTLTLITILSLGIASRGTEPIDALGFYFSRAVGSAEYVHKFGVNFDIDTGTDPEDVWNCPGIGANSLKTYLSGDDTIYISSDDASDTDVDVTVEGNDANGEFVSVSINLDGLTFLQVGTTGNWDRVYRAYVSGGTAAVGNLYIHTDDVDAAVADGIPDTPTTDIIACVLPEDQQTQMVHYTVPTNRVAYLKQGSVNVSPATHTAVEQLRAALKTRAPGGVWRVQDNIRLVSNGNGTYIVTYPFPLKLPGGTDVRAEVVSVSSDNTGVIVSMDFALMGD